MKAFEFGGKEHIDWLATNRTHEDCADCEFEFAQFPPCHDCPGHAAGPTPCHHYKKSVTHNAKLTSGATPEGVNDE